MTRAWPWVLGFVVAGTCGCEPPVQRGGLGVLNPRGLEGRVALAGQYTRGSTARVTPPAVVPHQRMASGTPSAGAVVQSPSP